jgi:hypothetical protein
MTFSPSNHARDERVTNARCVDPDRTHVAVASPRTAASGVAGVRVSNVRARRTTTGDGMTRES